MVIYQIQYFDCGEWSFHGQKTTDLSEARRLWLKFIRETSKYQDYKAARIVKCQQTRQGKWLIREVVKYKQLKEEEF